MKTVKILSVRLAMSSSNFDVSVVMGITFVPWTTTLNLSLAVASLQMLNSQQRFCHEVC